MVAVRAIPVNYMSSMIAPLRQALPSAGAKGSMIESRKVSNRDDVTVSPRPLYLEVKSWVTDKISTGEWKPGGVIPSESKLGATFGVSIGTIRKAVDELVAEQVLVRRQGLGTFVTAHNIKRLLFHFWHIARHDGTKEYPDVYTIDFKRGKANRDEARWLDIAPDEKVYRIRNLLKIGKKPAILDDITLPALAFPGLTEKIFVARENTIYQLYQSRYGVNVLACDERVRAAMASADTAAMLEIDIDSPILEIRRVSLTFRDKPVELRFSRVNGREYDYINTSGKAQSI
jgi:GntR family transcriptional regulator